MVTVVTVRDVCTQWGGAAKDSARDYLKIISVKEVRRLEGSESEVVPSTDCAEGEKMNRKGKYNRSAVDDPISDSDLEGPRSAASEDDLSLQSEDSVVEQDNDPLSEAIKLNFPEVKNEIRVTAKGDFLKTVDYGVHVFQHQGKVAVVLRGLGSAIQRTVDIANAIQRRIPVLQMASKIGSTPYGRSSSAPRPLVSFISIMLKVDSPLPVAPRPARQRRPANWYNRKTTPRGAPERESRKPASPRASNPDARKKMSMKTADSGTSTDSNVQKRNVETVAPEASSRTRRIMSITAAEANAPVRMKDFVRPDRPRSASVPRPGHGRSTKGRGGFNSMMRTAHRKKTEKSGGVLQDRRNVNRA